MTQITIKQTFLATAVLAVESWYPRDGRRAAVFRCPSIAHRPG